MKNVGAMEMPSKLMLMLDTLVCPMGMPISVVSDDADEQRALDLPGHQHAGEQQADQRQQRRAGGDRLLRSAAELLTGAELTMPAFSRPMQADEQADARADGRS